MGISGKLGGKNPVRNFRKILTKIFFPQNFDEISEKNSSEFSDKISKKNSCQNFPEKKTFQNFPGASETLHLHLHLHLHISYY